MYPSDKALYAFCMTMCIFRVVLLGYINKYFAGRHECRHFEFLFPKRTVFQEEESRVSDRGDTVNCDVFLTPENSDIVNCSYVD